MIEQDLKTIISLLEVLVGQKATGKIQTEFEGSPVDTVSVPDGTTDFLKIKETLPGLSKDQRTTWYSMCVEKSKSDKQKAAIAKIFKEYLQ